MVTQPQLDREAELDQLQSHVEHALRRASRGGADATEISAHASQGISVAVRLGQVDTLEHMQDRGISVSVMIGQRKGDATSADLSRESIDLCVQWPGR